MNTQPVWASADRPSFPSFSAAAETDVLIIGGGISGVTAAHQLAKAGKSVILLEKQGLATGETGHTTAHISYPTDKRYTALVRSFGEDHAQAIWDACQAASHHIAGNVRSEKIDCQLQALPAYLYGCGNNSEEEAADLRDEADLARRFGFDAHFTTSCPVTKRPAIVFSNLLTFHPAKYIFGLAKAAVAAGARIFEKSPADEFAQDKKEVTCNGHTLKYREVFIATHMPLQGQAGTLAAATFQTKLAAYSTYALGARIPKEAAPPALWWDTSDPYFYLRVIHDEEGGYAIAGGEDHKTGQVEETEARFTALTATLHALFPGVEVDRRWSGQVIETPDGLPYIGEFNGQFIATGYSGTGLTFGTLAAMMFADHALGITNPWRDLFRVDRKNLSGAWDYVKENKDYPWYLLKRPFLGEGADPQKLLAGEGKVLRIKGRKVAACRDDKGQVTLLSAICPHLGCVVAWNAAEKTWDCPCHGSRFTATGAVMGGPAESNLEAFEGSD